MNEYLPDATSFFGFPLLPKPEHYPDMVFVCPVCKGHGGWNLRLDAYGKNVHFNAHCFQCAGYGWVAERDATCAHDFKDYAVPAGHRSGLHYARCTKCGRETS